MDPGGPRVVPPDQGALVGHLVSAALDADQPAAMRIAERALAEGWTVDDVRFALVTPALYEVGRRWERAQIGVAEEHLATSVCEWVLFRLSGRRRRASASVRRAVVGCSEGEQHALGARIVAQVLAEHGWRVLHLGASTPVEAWAQVARARQPDLAIVCTTTASRLGPVPATVAAIKAVWPACRTVAGGQAYWSAPDPRAIGADLVRLDARDLAAELVGD
jgi:methanogenic corrinoid protein MtbC1